MYLIKQTRLKCIFTMCIYTIEIMTKATNFSHTTRFQTFANSQHGGHNRNKRHIQAFSK